MKQIISFLVFTFVMQHEFASSRPIMEQDSSDNNLTSMQSQQHTTNLAQTPQAAAISSPNTSHLKPPVIVSKPEETVVAPGSNVTLACEAQGSQPLTFVWFQDEKNLTKSNAPSTKLLEEKRYEILEEVTASNTTTSYLYLMNLRLTDTSLFLCWVENPAGYTFENYSLVVNDSLITSTNQAHQFATNLYQTPPINANKANYPSIPLIIAGLVMLIIVAIVFISIQLYQCRQDQQDRRMVSKKGKNNNTDNNNGGNEFKKLANVNEKSFSSNGSPACGKYTPSVVDSTDEEQDDDDGLSQTSSCNKNNLRVMAVNDLDGFIEQMRSGIINMDYHSMSPVIQFNKTNNQEQQVTTNQNVASGTQMLRAQSSLMTDQNQPLGQHPGQMFQSQQQLFHSTNFIAPNQSYVPATQTYHMQQPIATGYQQQPPQQIHQNQAVTHPQRPQSYHQLAYMNQFASSSSSHSSQTPFTNSYHGGNGYYY